MLNKKDFLKYASKLAFPIMIQNLIGTLVNVADTVMLGYVSQTAMSASSLANQYTFILFCLYYGMATGTSVLCAQYWGKGDKKTVEKILGLAERISLIVSLVFFVISFSMPTTIMKIFTNSPDTIAAGSEYLKVISFSFMFMGFSQVFMSALRSVGKIMLPSVTYIVSLCVNVFCNATFIFGLFGLPKLGVTGVALGTVIARIAEVLICLIYSLNSSDVRFRIKYFCAKSGILFRDFMKIASPAELYVVDSQLLLSGMYLSVFLWFSFLIIARISGLEVNELINIDTLQMLELYLRAARITCPIFIFNMQFLEMLDFL